MGALHRASFKNSLTPENNEDAGEKGDDSGNDAKVESKNSNQADEDEIDRQQQHSDVLVKGHGGNMEHRESSVECQAPCS